MRDRGISTFKSRSFEPNQILIFPEKNENTSQTNKENKW